MLPLYDSLWVYGLEQIYAPLGGLALPAGVAGRLTYTGTGTSFTPRNNAYSYNISGNAAFGTANGNQQNVSPANLFVGGTASTDGAFQLRTGSPAIGTGESGTDVGAFAGALPYRLSGIPNVPTIYQYSQSVSGNTLNATISTRSNN